MRRNLLSASLLVAGVLLAGCAGPTKDVTPARRSASELDVPPGGYPIDVHDPVESVNRGTYLFNAKFDEYVFLPLVSGYRYVMPDVFEDRVSDFFSNLTEIPTFINSLLQLNFDHAGRAAHRFFVNSTVGLLGFIDFATMVGYPQEREDFGQTLGVWGVGDGPYLVLPILGPSNLRDALGSVVDLMQTTVVTPTGVADSTAYDPAAYGLRPVDTRKNISFRYYQTGSPFEYSQVRLLYTIKRRLDIER